MALGVMSNRALGAPRHAILRALSEEIGETCNCTMFDGDHRVYFDRVEANWPYRIQLPVGSKLPLHCTASGKLFLAHMSPRQRKRMINAAPLKHFTDRTITDPKLLLKELKRIEDDGIDIDNEEFMAGMVAVAIPVFNASNEICFTIAVHAPSVRKPLEALRQFIPSLRQAAAAMAAAYCGQARTTRNAPRRHVATAHETRSWKHRRCSPFWHWSRSAVTYRPYPVLR